MEISDELTGDKKKVFDFFQTATLNELQLMNSCSKKKAESLVDIRPFKGWIDLVIIKFSINLTLILTNYFTLGTKTSGKQVFKH